MMGAGLDVQGGITSVERLMLENAPAELQIRHVPTFVKGSAARNIQTYIQAILTLIAVLLRQEADIVHIHFSERGSTLRKFNLAVITLIFRKPLVLHCHGATYQEFYAQLPPLARTIITAVFSKCTKFITLSQNWRDFCAHSFRLTPEQSVVMMNPVILPPQIPDRSSRALVNFVFLGRIGSRGGVLDAVSSFPQQDKGAFDLIRAFAALPVADRQLAKLTIAGNGDLEAAGQLIIELGAADRITIHPWLNPTQRDQLLATADAFVLPSYHEGLPMSMLEAMAWELPVIVTPVGGIPEVVISEGNGLLVTPGNQEELQNALRQLIQNPCLRSKLGQSGRQTVEALTIDSYMMKMMGLYITIMSTQERSNSENIKGLPSA
jgi:glycosyltransferase involved in cell wall biosynthesis